MAESRSCTASRLPPPRPPSFSGSGLPMPALETATHAALLLAGRPERIGQKLHARQMAGQDFQDAFAAVDLQAEAAVAAAAAAALGAKVTRRAAFQAVHGNDADRRPAGRCLRCRASRRLSSPACLLARRGQSTTVGWPPQEIDQVHDVAAEHPQVFAAAALIFLAAAAQLQQRAELPRSMISRTTCSFGL